MTLVQELVAKRSVTCAAVLIAVFAIFLQMNTTLNHDAAWHFQTSLMWLGGGVIGKDIVDFNPPMTLWYSAPAALFVKLTGVSPRLVFKTYVLLTILLSFGLCRYFLKSKVDDLGVRIFALGFAAILLLYPNYHFGQREHLSVVLFLPYLILSIYDRSDWSVWVLVCAGFMATIGIGFKPHFVLVPIFLESALILYNRSLKQVFRVEALSLIGGLLLYLLAIFAIAPNYLVEVLPSALWSYEQFESSLINIYYFKFGGMILIFSMVLLIRKAEFQKEFILIAAVSLAYAVIAFLQNKGWEYQWVPFIATALLTLLFISVRASQIWIRSCLAMGAILYVSGIEAKKEYFPQFVNNSVEFTSNTQFRVARLTNLFDQYAEPGDYVYAFITSPRDIHPAVLEAGLKWSDSAGALLYTPAILAAGIAGLEPEYLARIEHFDREILKNLFDKKPKIIAVNFSNRLAVKDEATSYVDHFSTYPGFQEFWAEYRLAENVDNFQIWVSN